PSGAQVHLRLDSHVQPTRCPGSPGAQKVQEGTSPVQWSPDATLPQLGTGDASDDASRSASASFVDAPSAPPSWEPSGRAGPPASASPSGLRLTSPAASTGASSAPSIAASVPSSASASCAGGVPGLEVAAGAPAFPPQRSQEKIATMLAATAGAPAPRI